MELTEEQHTSVKAWIEDGAGLSDVQKRLQEEFGVSMTYMDVRFLVLDLGVDVKEKPSAAPPPAADAPATAPPAADAPLGGVSVSLDRVMKPGAVASGSVTFSDGTAATWMLDQMGRLALDAGDPDYRPAEQDLREFQQALQQALQKQGY